MVGEPKLFCSTTLRPLGPRVTLTARASLPMPRRIASRASWSNAICFAAILPPVGKKRVFVVRGMLFVDHGQDVLFAHQQDVVAAALLELVAGPVGEQDGVADLDLERPAGAVLHHAAGADGEHLALLRLVLGRVRQDDAAGRLLLGLETFDDD